MTHCTIASCARTGRFGLAIASHDLAVGFSRVHVVARVGAVVRLGPREMAPTCALLNLVGLGFSPAAALTQSGIGPDTKGAKQIAVAGTTGRTAVWTESDPLPWSGHVDGDGYACFGTGLPGREVVDAMAAAFAGGADLDLDARLLASLEAAQQSGSRSAALIVYGSGVHSEIDLRVDLHDDAVGRLRAVYDFHKPYEAFYRLRSENPRQTPPQEAFMATIAPDAEPRP